MREQRGHRDLRVHGRLEHRQDLAARLGHDAAADEDAALAVGDQLDDALLLGQPAAGAEVAGRDRHVEACVARGLLAQAHRGHLRGGERDPRDRAVVGPGTVLAERVADHDRRLVHRHVREGALARDVADRPEQLTRSHPLVGLDHLEVVGQAHGVEADEVEVGVPPGGDQQLLRPHRLAVHAQREAVVVVGHGVDRGAGEHGDALVGERLGEHLGGLGLLDRDQAVGHLDDGDVDAVPREDLRELAADRSSAEHDQRRGQVGHGHRVAVGPVRRPLQAVDRRRGRAGAGVEHHALAGDVRRAADADASGPVQHAAAAMETGAAVLEALDRDRVVPVVGGLVAHPAGDLGPVGLDRRGPTEVGDLARGGDHVGRRDHHLRGHAAVVRALAADEAVLDADDVQAGAGQLDGDVLTPGPEAQDDDVDLDVGRLHGVGHCRQVPARAKQNSP